MVFDNCFKCTWCKNEYELDYWVGAKCKHPNHEFVIGRDKWYVENSKCDDFNKIKTQDDLLKEKCGFRTRPKMK